MKRFGSFITGLLVGAMLFGGTVAYAAGVVAERAAVLRTALRALVADAAAAPERVTTPVRPEREVTDAAPASATDKIAHKINNNLYIKTECPHNFQPLRPILYRTCVHPLGLSNSVNVYTCDKPNCPLQMWSSQFLYSSSY